MLNGEVLNDGVPELGEGRMRGWPRQSTLRIFCLRQEI
jgi:hypothetical protein